MRLVLNNIIIFIFIFIFIKGLAAKDLSAHYKIELGSLDLGTLEWILMIEKKNYTTSMILKDRGFFSKIYRFNGEYLSKGKIVNNIFVSSKYTQYWKTKKKTRWVEIIFKDKKISSMILKPIEKESPRINHLDIENLNDPLSSFLNVLLNDNTDFKTIDGRRLYKMSTELKKKGGIISSKKIIIKDYVNIWTDHKRNDLKFILVTQDLSEDKYFPIMIKIKNKGLTFTLTKI